MDKQDEFEERKPIEPILGQMCYDELLLPENEEGKVEQDISVAAGQLDFWSVPKQEEKQAFQNEVKINDKVEKAEIETFEKEEKSDESFKPKTDQQPQEKSQADERFDTAPEVVLSKLETSQLTGENDKCQQEETQKIELQKNNFLSEKVDDFEEENPAFQSPRKLKSKLFTKSDFEKFDGIEKENFEESKAKFSVDEQQEVAEENQEEPENEPEFQEEVASEAEDEFEINFENPPKKLEKTEINASKTHFFGNYENPFDE